MKGLAKTTASFFHSLFNACDENGGHIKFENSESFMPLSVEAIGGNEQFDFYSCAHYYTQNGDLLPDPEITFAVAKWTREADKLDCLWIGVKDYYQPPLFGRSISVQNMLSFDSEGNISHWKPTQFKGTLSFCSTWARNIKNQQSLKLVKGVTLKTKNNKTVYYQQAA